MQLYTHNIDDDAKFAKSTWIKIQLPTANQQVENCLFTKIYHSTNTSH